MSSRVVNTTAKRLSDLLWSRFVGDIGKTDRYLLDSTPVPIWSSAPLTEEVVAAHVLGNKRIGVGQIGMTLFGVLDFDGKVKDADGNRVLDPVRVEQAWAYTRRVVALFEQYGFKVLVEVSRSGGGWHVWILCDPVDPPTVEEMRRMLKAVLRLASLPDDGNEGAGHPGIFPHPAGPGGCGRTPFLPWSGLLNGKVGGLFVDVSDGVPIDRQETVLEDPTLATREQIVAALKALDDAPARVDVNAAIKELIRPPLDLMIQDGEHAYPKVQQLAMKLRNHHPKEFGAHLVFAYAEKHGVVERHGLDAVQRLIDSAWDKPPLFVMTEFDLEKRIDVGSEWPELIPLDRYKVPLFPTETLTPALKSFVDETAKATRTPQDLSGCMVLSAVSTAIGGKFKVHAQDGWDEPVNSYNLVALRSGELKSPVFRAVMEPIEHYERMEHLRLESAIRASNLEFRVRTKKLEKAEKAAANSTDTAGLALREAMELARELDENPPLVRPRFVVDDVTPEKLSQMLQVHGGRLAVLSAEGGIFSNVFGRYTRDNQPKLDAILHAHDAEPIICDRSTRVGEHILNPALTMGLAVQPSILEMLMANDFAEAIGLLPRFNYSCPVSLMGSRVADPEPVSDAARTNYAKLILTLMELPARRVGGDLDPLLLRISPGAHQRLIRLHDEIEPRLGPNGDLYSMSAWVGKMRGKVLRLAAQLHFSAAAEAGTLKDHPLSEETFARAEKLGWYFLDHARKAYDVMGGNPATVEAKIMLAWIESKRLTSFTVRDVYRELHTSFPAAEAPLRGLKALTDRGYIRPSNAARAGSGRNPSPRYDVNPVIVTS